MRPTPPPIPAHYWTMLMAVAGLALSAIGLMMNSGKDDRDEIRRQATEIATLKARLCQLETREFGKCDTQ